MAVFSKDDNKKSTESMTSGATIIASGTKINGDITLSSSLHIDGEVEGVIRSDNVVTVGIKGKISGEITAKNLVINGIFRGTSESQSVEILPKGDVKGKLTYSELTIEKGGLFEGETTLRPAATETNVSKFTNPKKADLTAAKA